MTLPGSGVHRIPRPGPGDDLLRPPGSFRLGTVQRNAFSGGDDMISRASATGCSILGLSSALAIAAVMTVAATPANPQPGPGRAAMAGAPATPGREPTGSGSCAAWACHGSPRPVAGLAVLRNEYTTWIVRDRHAQAYQVLLEPRSADILGKLGWKGP